MDNMFKRLKKHRHDLPKQTLKTIRGQALSGDLEGAKKGLEKALNKKQDNKKRMINAHRKTRYIDKQYEDIDYKAQLSINLRK